MEPPVRLAHAELLAYRDRHPLARLMPLFDSLLAQDADAAECVYALSDAEGTLLWVRGHHGTRALAERINFAEGAGWSEAQAGTNALGTVLAVGEPVRILRAEHFNPAVRPWSCIAAPIHDPGSGRLLGVIDVTGRTDLAAPHALALVRATAEAAEAHLALASLSVCSDHRAIRSAAAPEAEARLSVLNRHHALLELGSRRIPLRPRHGEILLQLALAPQGLTGPQLAVALSEQEITPVTLRAEVSRLRACLGVDWIDSHPYRLRMPMWTDVGEVLDLLARGRVAEAVAAYAGPPLPASDAPAVVDLRMSVARRIRAEVLRAGDTEALRRWLTSGSGVNDAAAWRALADRLPGGSAERAEAAARAKDGNRTATVRCLASRSQDIEARPGRVDVKA